MDTFYYCSLDINDKDCPKKKLCKRYVNKTKDDTAYARLYNICNETNDYKLFLKVENNGC